MAGSIGVISGEILSLVSKSAPLLGTVLGSPLAGVAISLIASAFGVHPSDINSLTQALTQSPDAAIKLKQLEEQHVEALAQIASQDYATEVDDRKDARKNAVLYKDFLRHMAYLVTFGFFAALLLMFAPIPINDNDKQLLSMLVGMLVSKWQTIIDFFYGSSRTNNQGGLNK